VLEVEVKQRKWGKAFFVAIRNDDVSYFVRVASNLNWAGVAVSFFFAFRMQRLETKAGGRFSKRRIKCNCSRPCCSRALI
jgi:hypothetical protein